MATDYENDEKAELEYELVGHLSEHSQKQVQQHIAKISSIFRREFNVKDGEELKVELYVITPKVQSIPNRIN